MSAPRFVSAPIVPGTTFFGTPALDAGEPPLPATFGWGDEELALVRVERAWRSTSVDRGDAYLARHWFEVVLADGRTAVLYFDRKALRGKPRWWLYTIAEVR